MTGTQDHAAMLLLQYWSLDRSALLDCFHAKKGKLRSELEQRQESLRLVWNAKPRPRTVSDYFQHRLEKLDLDWQYDAKLKELEFQHKEAVVNHYNAFLPFTGITGLTSNDITAPSDTAYAVSEASTSTPGPKPQALQVRQVPLQQDRVAKRPASSATISVQPPKQRKVQISSTRKQVTAPTSRRKIKFFPPKTASSFTVSNVSNAADIREINGEEKTSREIQTKIKVKLGEGSQFQVLTPSANFWQMTLAAVKANILPMIETEITCYSFRLLKPSSKYYCVYEERDWGTIKKRLKEDCDNYQRNSGNTTCLELVIEVCSDNDPDSE
ncbi:hypothetical protein LZ30DRAFT_738978 [Colletotrichum cereale]|nr:hypothetical protein LZ30DRAFT_738978 [Colletotrichum cereale]